MPTGQQPDGEGSQQEIEQRMAQARQRFQGLALQLFRLCSGEQVDADAEREVVAGIEQIIAADSIEMIETFSRLLSDLMSMEQEQIEAWSTRVLSAPTLAEMLAAAPVLRVDRGRE